MSLRGRPLAYVAMTYFLQPLYLSANQQHVGIDTGVADGEALLTCEAVKAAEALETEGISAMVINMATINPLDEELVLAAAKKCGKVVTCEEHSVIGGLGEAVSHLLSEKHPTKVKCIGVNDEFGHSGPAGELLKQFGLSAEGIIETARSFLKT